MHYPLKPLVQRLILTFLYLVEDALTVGFRPSMVGKLFLSCFCRWFMTSYNPTPPTPCCSKSHCHSCHPQRKENQKSSCEEKIKRRRKTIINLYANIQSIQQNMKPTRNQSVRPWKNILHSYVANRRRKTKTEKAGSYTTDMLLKQSLSSTVLTVQQLLHVIQHCNRAYSNIARALPNMGGIPGHGLQLVCRKKIKPIYTVTGRKITQSNVLIDFMRQGVVFLMEMA